MLLADMISELGTILGDPNADRFTDVQKVAWLNSGQDAVVTDAITDVLWMITETNISTSESPIAIPTNMRRLLFIERADKTCRLISANLQFDAKDPGSLHYATAENPVAYFENRALHFLPSSNTTHKLHYIEDPRTMAQGDTNTESLLQAELHRPIIQYAAFLGFASAKDPERTEWFIYFRNSMARINEEYNNKSKIGMQ